MPAPPKTPMPKGMPNWNMRHWDTGQPMTFLEALGFSRDKMKFPSLKATLPTAAGQYARPIAVQQNPSSQAFGEKKPPTPKQVGTFKQYARRLLVQRQWANQFPFLNDIVMAESGWNPHIKNPQSGAYGIAQANTHHPQDQGTESDMYGGFGLTTKQAKAANSGNGYWQLVWMFNYIKQRYGSPQAAWRFHQQNGWY